MSVSIEIHYRWLREWLEVIGKNGIVTENGSNPTLHVFSFYGSVNHNSFYRTDYLSADFFPFCV